MDRFWRSLRVTLLMVYEKTVCGGKEVVKRGCGRERKSERKDGRRRVEELGDCLVCKSSVLHTLNAL